MVLAMVGDCHIRPVAAGLLTVTTWHGRRAGARMTAVRAWFMSRMEPLLLRLRSCATQPIGLGREGGALPVLGSSYSRPEILENYVSTQLNKVVRRSSRRV